MAAEGQIQLGEMQPTQELFSDSETLFPSKEEEVFFLKNNFISPDFPLFVIPPSCSSYNCFVEMKRLQSQLHESVAAHHACKDELEAVRRELDVAKEQLVSLRAQLEENTHALCAYLCARR